MSVLHSRYKLTYFREANWPPEWIDAAVTIIREQWEEHYKPKAASVEQPMSSVRINIAHIPLTSPTHHRYQTMTKTTSSLTSTTSARIQLRMPSMRGSHHRQLEMLAIRLRGGHQWYLQGTHWRPWHWTSFQLQPSGMTFILYGDNININLHAKLRQRTLSVPSREED